MTSFVTIWVTVPESSLKFPVSWGAGMIAMPHKTSGSVIISVGISTDSTAIRARETPAEVAALVAAEIRKQRRYEVAARIRDEIGYFALPEEEAKAAAMSIQAADALLDALEGAAS